jgi:osmotically-inducible protein OsmY
MLSGNVSSQAAIDEAVQVVAATGGVKCVQNFLHVGPPLAEAPQQQP